jgi:hypothetical protein
MEQRLNRRLDVTEEMKSANSSVLGGRVRTHHCGELLFLEGTATPIEYANTIERLFCDHEYVEQSVSSGGGWMSTTYALTYCNKCGSIKKAIRL